MKGNQFAAGAVPGELALERYLVLWPERGACPRQPQRSPAGSIAPCKSDSSRPGHPGWQPRPAGLCTVDKYSHRAPQEFGSDLPRSGLGWLMNRIHRDILHPPRSSSSGRRNSYSSKRVSPENTVRVATVSAFCEPWVFRRFHKPTLPANCAVGVATHVIFTLGGAAWRHG